MASTDFVLLTIKSAVLEGDCMKNIVRKKRTEPAEDETEYFRQYMDTFDFSVRKIMTTGIGNVENLGSCHKRQKPQAPTPQAPIRNRQTRKVANAKVLNRNTNLT